MHGGVAKDQAAAAEKHLVEGLHQRRVQSHLGGQHAHVLDAVARGAVPSRPERVRSLRELDLQHQVELRREHLAGLKEPNERGRDERVSEVAVQDCGRVAQVRRVEALISPAVVPLLRLEQAVEPAAAAVLGDVIRPLPVAEELYALDEAITFERAWEDLAAASVGVSHPEGDFHALRVDEVHAAGQRDPGHAAGRGREGAE